MKYVRTFRAFDSREMVHAYEHISSKQFNSITVAFVHGAKLNGTRWEKARVCWQWEMVDAMPKAYILRGMTTTDKAYNFGKELIDACYKANRVPFELMQEAYKAVYRLLKAAHCRTYHMDKNDNFISDLPNPTIYPEVNAEDSCLGLIQDIWERNEDCKTPFQKNLEAEFGDEGVEFCKKMKYWFEMPDELLRFYCRAFQTEAPTWWISAKPVAQTYINKDDEKVTLYAICPEISGSYNASYSSDYAGNLDENGDTQKTAPYTLLKDSKPQKLAIEDRKVLIDSINYFLSLPIEEQKNFLADNFEYTKDGELIEISPEEREERELAMIKEAIRLNTARLYAGITG